MRRLGTLLLVSGLAIGCGPPTGSSQSGVPRVAKPPAGAGAGAEETRREVRESANTGRAAEQQKREEYQRQFQAQMDKLNDEIKDLGERAAKAGADARVRLDRQLADLKEQQAELQKKWDAVKASSGDAWEEMKGGMERAYGELRRSFDRAAAEFNK
jgi:chromosome segregation ATPase